MNETEINQQENHEFDMQQEALEAGQFFANEAKAVVTEPHNPSLAQKYENNRTLDKDQVRNFWYTKNHEVGASFSSNHAGKNTEELYKLFSSGAKKDDWHASMAESCAYRNMVAHHKVEAADNTVPNYDVITAQHKVEVELFDVYRDEMKGKEPDVSQLDVAYQGYEKVTERIERKQRIAAREAERELDPGTISTRDKTKYRSQHAQVKHISSTELEDSLRQRSRAKNFQSQIGMMRNKSKE